MFKPGDRVRRILNADPYGSFKYVGGDYNRIYTVSHVYTNSSGIDLEELPKIGWLSEYFIKVYTNRRTVYAKLP